MIRPVTMIAAAAVATLSGPVLAAPGQAARLMEVLRTDEMTQIMSDEGHGYAGDLAEGLFPGRKDLTDWNAVVQEIYDPERMAAAVIDRFEAEIKDTSVAEAIAFFESPLGEKIVSLELEARVAMADDGFEADARELARALATENSPQYRLVTEFIEANNLLERNVIGGLNSNFAFYQGLSAGGGLPVPMTEDDMLRDVWAGEPDMRQDTEEWLYAYLLLAYGPLTEGEMQSYIDLSTSEQGRALYNASFAAYDALFEQISHALGLAAARYTVGQDL